MMNWPDKISKALNIQYPIIQAPMLGICTPEMVAAVANAGGLGSLPVGVLPADRVLELIRKTKNLTSKPFAVNLFVNDPPKGVDVIEFDTMQAFLRRICAEDGIMLVEQNAASLKFNTYKNLIDVLIAENIPIVSFTFGVLDDESIRKLKANNTILIGTATSVAEAKILDEKGIDMIVAQGAEAGGHRGSFLNMTDPPLIGSMTLIPSIAAVTDKPVIASGGICDGKSISAAFTLGASAVQMGTVFLASHESLATPSWKQQLISAREEDIILTNAFTGRWARGLRNKLSEQVKASGLAIPLYPIQGTLTGPIRMQAQKNNNTGYMVMLRGQSQVKIEEKGSAEIFLDLVRQTEKAFDGAN
jgi:nitronate monooxygenase